MFIALSIKDIELCVYYDRDNVKICMELKIEWEIKYCSIGRILDLCF